MAIIRRDFLSGQVKNNPLGLLGTSILSDQFADIPTLASGHPDTFKLILDPLSQNGDPEIVYVTEHTASSDIVVVTRGEEGTTAREHPLGTSWFHGPTADDFDSLAPPDITGKVDKAGDTMSGELILADNLLTRPRIKDYAEAGNDVGTTAGATNIDLENGNCQEITLGGDHTLTFTNPPATGWGSLTLVIKQDATGTRIPTWGSTIKWAEGTAPELSTTASAIDILTFITPDAGTTWYGFNAGLAFA